MARLSLHRYDIVASRWEVLTFDQAQAIAQAANTLPWQGSQPHRYGLTQCVTLGDPDVAIVGFYAQEFEREQRILTEDKGEQRQMEEHAERYLFVVLPNLRLVSLQAKKVARMPPRQELVARFADLLRFAFARQFLNFGGLERRVEGNSRDDYLEAFFSTETERVTLLALRDLTLSPADDFPYFNPNYELNAVFRRANEADRREISEVRLVAPPAGNLKHSPSARGFIAASSDPREMHIITRLGRRVLKTREESSIQVDVEEPEPERITGQTAVALTRATAEERHAPRARVRRPPRVGPAVVQSSLFGEDGK